MALEPDNPLDRAIAAARDEQPEGWAELRESVMDRVRLVLLPSQPLLVRTPEGAVAQDADGSRTTLQSRVVVTALRRLMSTSPTHALSDVRLEVEDQRLVALEVDLVASYGLDLRALADDVRVQVVDLVRDLLGPDPDFGAGSVSVHVVDVVESPSDLR